MVAALGVAMARGKEEALPRVTHVSWLMVWMKMKVGRRWSSMERHGGRGEYSRATPLSP